MGDVIVKKEIEIEDTVKGKRGRKQIDRGFDIARKWTKDGEEQKNTNNYRDCIRTRNGRCGMNKEKKQQYGKKYYQEHREERQRYSKKYNQEHREEVKNRRMKYRREHRIHDAINKRHWYLINKAQLFFLLTNGKMCCADCGNDNFEVFTIDHIKGGDTQERKETRVSAILQAIREMNSCMLDKNKYDVICCNCQHLRALDIAYPKLYTWKEFKAELRKW